MPLTRPASRTLLSHSAVARGFLPPAALTLLCSLATAVAACSADPKPTKPAPPSLPKPSVHSVATAASTFRSLQAGTEYATFELPSSAVGDSKLHVVRIDPTVARPVLAAAERGDGVSRTAAEWGRDRRFAVVINAGMYAQDLKSHVGYMRAYGHALEPTFNKDYQSVVVWGPRKPGLPALDILDLDSAPGEKQRAQDFDVALQNLRLIKGPGENVWSEQPKRWSEAALAVDQHGKLLFLFSRSPYSMREFNESLLKLPLDIIKAQHLEGGPEASLSVHAGGVDLDLSGSYETAFTEHDGNRKQWVLPNVIGIERADAPNLTFPLELDALCDSSRRTLDTFSDEPAPATPAALAPEASCAEVERSIQNCGDLKLRCEPEVTRVVRSSKGFVLHEGDSGSGAFNATETYLNPSECRTLSIVQHGAYGDPFVSVSFDASTPPITEAERTALMRLKGWPRADANDPAHALDTASFRAPKRLLSGEVEIWSSGRGTARAFGGRPQLPANSLTFAPDDFRLTAMLPEFLTAVALDPWELSIACYDTNRHARVALALYDRKKQQHRWIVAFPDGETGGNVRLLGRWENLLFARLHNEQAHRYEDRDIVIDLQTASYFVLLPKGKLSGVGLELTDKGLRWSRANAKTELTFADVQAAIAAQQTK